MSDNRYNRSDYSSQKRHVDSTRIRIIRFLCQTIVLIALNIRIALIIHLRNVRLVAVLIAMK